MKRNDLTAMFNLYEYVAKQMAVYMSRNRAAPEGSNTTAADDKFTCSHNFSHLVAAVAALEYSFNCASFSCNC